MHINRLAVTPACSDLEYQLFINPIAFQYKVLAIKSAVRLINLSPLWVQTLLSPQVEVSACSWLCGLSWVLYSTHSLIGMAGNILGGAVKPRAKIKMKAR